MSEGLNASQKFVGVFKCQPNLGSDESPFVTFNSAPPFWRKRANSLRASVKMLSYAALVVHLIVDDTMSGQPIERADGWVQKIVEPFVLSAKDIERCSRRFESPIYFSDEEYVRLRMNSANFTNARDELREGTGFFVPARFPALFTNLLFQQLPLNSERLGGVGALGLEGGLCQMRLMFIRLPHHEHGD